MGQARSLGSIVNPVLNNKDCFSGRCENLLVVQRSPNSDRPGDSFSVEGDSGGPVYFVNDSDDGSLQLIGCIEGCLETHQHYSCVSLITKDVLDKVNDFYNQHG